MSAGKSLDFLHDAALKIGGRHIHPDAIHPTNPLLSGVSAYETDLAG